MKKKFKNRRKLQELATTMGLESSTVITGQQDPITQKPYYQLVNNQRRFVRGLLKLPLKEQQARIAELEKIISEQEALDALQVKA
jgi:hypothetical protein